MDDSTPEPTDNVVRVTYQNSLILGKMRAMGIKTVTDLSRLSKVHQSVLSKLISMYISPTRGNGDWTTPALKLSNFFECSPEILFGELQQEHALDENRTQAEIYFGTIQVLLSERNASFSEPSTSAEREELLTILDQAISELKPRQQEVLRSRFEFDMTFEEIGDKLHITPERVRQIEARCIRFLRQPRFSDRIREAAGIPRPKKYSWL